VLHGSTKSASDKERFAVIQAESAVARNVATDATSFGWPMRPSGVCASTCLRKSLSIIPAGMYAFGFNHPRVNGVTRNFLRPKFFASDLGNRIDCSLGCAVDGSPRRRTDPPQPN
jgi:hypothetical protein